MSRYIQINTTSDQKETLQSIARMLIEQKLVACVQIGGPIESSYCWQGKFESSIEWTCTIKTMQDKWQSVQRLILAEHNYDQPELVWLEIAGGSAGYLKWLGESLCD